MMSVNVCRVVVIGAGPAGCYAALALLRTGAFADVHVFEKRPRNISEERGRNINITLCKRGIECLHSCGIDVTGCRSEGLEIGPKVKSVAMTHFKLHGSESSLRLPYKDCIPVDMPLLSPDHVQTREEHLEPAINSVHRNALYYVLVEACEKAGVKFHFEHEYKSVKLIPKDDRIDLINAHEVQFTSKDDSKITMTAAIVIGADGVHSDVARYITTDQDVVNYDKNLTVNKLLSHHKDRRILEHCQFGYRELSVPANVSLQEGLELDTFHIWSTNSMVVLGLPSSDGSLTIGIYGPSGKMKSLPLKELIADVIQEFPHLGPYLCAVPSDEVDKHDGSSHRIGTLQTLINPNFVKDGVVLIGDAAHAMLPFLGQGLNSGLEDTKSFIGQISEWTKLADDKKSVGHLYALMSKFNTTRKADIHIIQEQSRCELERMLSLKELFSQDVNPASFALSRFFYFAGFSTLQYGDAWRRSLPKKVLVGASVKEGDILAQVESVKTMISVVAPCSGQVTGVKEQSHGVPEYEITPRKKNDSDSARNISPPAQPSATNEFSSDLTLIQKQHLTDNKVIWDTQKSLAPFELPVFHAGLKTSFIGRCLLYSEKTGSTMDDARELFDKGCIHGTTCLSETMTAGRGRQGSKWTSPPKGNIYVTIVLRILPEQEDQIKKVQFATAVAVCTSIREAGVGDTVVKWPNDIWVRGHKMAGILIEVYRNAAIKDETSGCTAILVGIGINVNDNPRLNKNLREQATSIANELGHIAPRETLLANICNHLEKLCQQDMETILETFQSLHLWSPGSCVEVIPKVGASYFGIIEKIENDGSLKITGHDGTTEYLSDIGLSVRPVPKSTIFVYNGKGCSEQSLHMLFTSLKMFADTSKYSIKMIGPSDVIEGSWTKSAAMIAFGGGFDCGYIESLGDKGIAVVLKYVEEGGSYLGICAGGYFGCADIVFDQGRPLEVCGERDLKFFPGKCIGPVFPGFRYNSEEGAHAAEVLWMLPSSEGHMSNARLHTYFNGGGAFIIPDSFKDGNKIKVIANYASVKDEPAAVINCQVGKGTAVLSGVHFEYLPQDLQVTEGSPLENIVPKLIASQDTSIKCFRSVLEHLSVT